MVRRLTSAVAAAIAVIVLTGAPVDAGGRIHDQGSSESAGRAVSETTPRSVRSLDEAMLQDVRRFGWPLVLGAAVMVFLGFQNRSERHERKLADAPLDQGERLRFK